MTLPAEGNVRAPREIEPSEVEQVLVDYKTRSPGVIFGVWFEPLSSLNGPKKKLRKMTCHFGELPSDFVRDLVKSPADPEAPKMVDVYEVCNRQTINARIRRRAAKTIEELEGTLKQHQDNQKKVRELVREINKQKRRLRSPASFATKELAIRVGININGVRRLTMEHQVIVVNPVTDKPQQDLDADLTSNAGAIG